MKTATPPKGKTVIDVLRASSLARIPWLVHGFSTRTSGISRVYGGNALNLGFTAQDKKAAVEKNRRAFAAAVNEALNRDPENDLKAMHGRTDQQRPSRQGRRNLISPARERWVRGKRTQVPEGRHTTVWPIVTVRQIHSDLIHRVSNSAPLAGDGLVTNTPGILLGILTADCLPIILVDTKIHSVGVFHAGWRGTLKRIVEKGVGEMQRWFGTRPQDLKAAIGPGIRGCCYQVGPEVKSKFESQFDYVDSLFRETKDRDQIHEKYPLLFLTSRAPGHSVLPKQIFLELGEANRRQLIDAGVPAKNITDLGLCTSCHTELFFSHRADKGITGRMMAAVGIRG